MLGIDEQSAEPKDLLRDFLDAAAMAIAVVLVGIVFVGAAGLPRILLALAFAFFVPGRAVVTNWPRLAHWSEFGMPIVISLAVLTLAAATALWAHEWHPVGLFEIEAGVSAVALGVGMARRHVRIPRRSDRPVYGPPGRRGQLPPERKSRATSADRAAAEPPPRAGIYGGPARAEPADRRRPVIVLDSGQSSPLPKGQGSPVEKGQGSPREKGQSAASAALDRLLEFYSQNAEGAARTAADAADEGGGCR